MCDDVAGDLTFRSQEMKTLFGIILISIICCTDPSAQNLPSGNPEATIDLTTVDGTRTVQGEWRYSDTKIVGAEFKTAGADGQPTGPAAKTYDYEPHAGGSDFNDAAWEKIAATDLVKRRGNGRLSFNWYRINITVPEKVVDFDPTG
jgi:hypothetical protein